jgi:mRNA interferase YafQ
VRRKTRREARQGHDEAAKTWRSCKDLAKLKAALSSLIEQQVLPDAYGDHPLKGDWRGYRDLHIEPDWLLLYRVVGDELHLARTGSHADLFAE